MGDSFRPGWRAGVIRGRHVPSKTGTTPDPRDAGSSCLRSSVAAVALRTTGAAAAPRAALAAALGAAATISALPAALGAPATITPLPPPPPPAATAHAPTHPLP